jgi:membrane peptidoglycan carboxypeptidase
MVKKPNRRLKTMSLYANLAARRKNQRDAKARRKAEYLATLPKHPLKRLAYRLHPKRVMKFWFSKQGALTFLKLVGVGFIIMAIFIAALFAYYRRELDAIRPDELAKRVQTTVSKYVDRNGVLLWEDKGDSKYQLVVQSGDISNIMKQATIAVEDKDYYKHGGISITAIIRAGLSDVSGGEVQGASTLTQQLIKLVFFSQEAQANRLDISRKIKEIILAIEVERMYNKDQILTMYLNEAPYGGRRNGVESAALTYFGKKAKDLTVAEAALLAAIPKDPSYYNPYNVEGNKDLITRQHKVIGDMLEQGYINQAQADEAKKVPILDTIKPELDATEDIKAPHFVLEVRSQLEKEFGTKLIRDGGLTIKTTLDYRIQQVAEQQIRDNYKFATQIGANNMALTATDVPTGQVLVMVGSHDYTNKEYGEVNAATALLNPGSSIKPFMYANLFKPREVNYGAGSILADDNIDKLYGSKLQNFDGKFRGTINIRDALGSSRNPPAVKAAYIGGLDAALNTTREAGNKSYCIGVDYGLSAAIGSCAVKQIEHVAAYATLASQGIYHQPSYVLEVKNAQGQTIKQWKDESKRVLDPQITYILSDILADDGARAYTFGRNAPGFNVPGVKTAAKSGTTDDGKGHAKDSWLMSYSPKMSVGIWTGRNDPKALTSLSSRGNQSVITEVQKYAHTQIFQKEGSWKPGDWYQQPAGIQRLSVNGRNDIFPSWYTKPKTSEEKDIVFDQVSKKKATDCTPSRAKITHKVQSFQDPITKQITQTAPDGYDANADDNVHSCGDAKPFVTVTADPIGGKNYKITANVNQGTFPLSSVEFFVDGQNISSQAIGGPGNYSVNHTMTSGTHSVSATVIDQGLYDGTNSITKNVAGNGVFNNFLADSRRRR